MSFKKAVFSQNLSLVEISFIKVKSGLITSKQCFIQTFSANSSLGLESARSFGQVDMVIR